VSALTWGVFGVGGILQVAVWLRRAEMFWPPAVFAVACTFAAALSAATHDAAGTWINLICAVLNALAAWSWWRRRKRRRAPRALGAKSRARIAAMVTRMRERPARPVLRPVPGGAR
jgi:membrane protein implicated in regulation of membrane protease activity